MNTGVHVSFSIMVSSGFMPSSGIAGLYGSFILVFKEISMLSSIVAVSTYIPTNSARGYPFLHILSTSFIACRLFDDGHSDQCEMIVHCSFDFGLQYFCTEIS